MAELTFLTDIIDDKHFEDNQDALEIITIEYTKMFDLAMGRGLILEEEI